MKLCLQFCWKIENQESSANTVELEHINEEFNKKSNSLYTKVASLEAGPETFKYLTHYHEHTKREHDLLGDQSDEDVEGVENAKWTTIKAVLLLLLGIVIAASFADPLVDAVDNFSSATSIPSFFISFTALPLANNSSEAVSAIIFASCKRLRSASLTFSETLIMGNRDAIDEMSGTNAAVLLSILKLIEKYDLYGQVAYPKRHEQSEVPDIYRLAAKTKVKKPGLEMSTVQSELDLSYRQRYQDITIPEAYERLILDTGIKHVD